MRVRAIRVAAFMSHDHTEVELPEAGVVLVTGSNGQGKSTLMEAVAHAVWGKSIRGAPGWRDGEAGGVQVDLDAGLVRRSCSPRGKKKLEWRIGEDGAGEYPTLTKAQFALEQTVGPFDVWLRSCVFSSAEASRFTTATDRERKLLLEELLQLDRLTRAYDEARADRRSAEVEAAELARAAQAGRDRAAALRAQEAQAREAASEQEGVQVSAALARERRQELEDKLAELSSQLATADIAVARREVARREAVEMRLADDARRVTGLGPECPKCQQVIDPAHVAELADELGECHHEAGELADAARARLRELEQAERARSESESAARYELAEVDAELRHASLCEARARDWSDRADALAVEAEEAEVGARASAEEAARATARLAELEAACQVLGLNGARVGLLADALRHVERTANAWLAELGKPGLRVRLDTAEGSDRIVFEVDGAGGGHGYRASSGGERRRIDIAVMLALADVASTGVDDGSTMFFDELFDALDDAGVEDAVTVIKRISARRCIVVVSHNRELVAHLPEARHLVVETGEVRG